jgi:MFS family permease
MIGHGAPDWIASRNLCLLVASRMTMSMVTSLAGIVVPIYLARLGFRAVQIGVLFTATAATTGLLTALSGLLADRYGRKPFLFIFPLFTAAAGLVYLVTRSFPLLVAVSAVGSIGRGGGAGGGVGPYAPAQQAMVAAAVPTHHRNAAFGLVAFAATVGALVGGLLGGVPDLATGAGLTGLAAYRPAFLLLCGLALVAAGLALPLRETSVPAASSRGRALALPRRSLPLLLRLMATNAVGGLAMGAFGPFITYWFYIRYGAGPGAVGLLYAVVNIASLAPNLAAASIARRLGLVRAVTVVRSVASLLLIVMVFMPSFALAGAIYLVRMVLQRIGMPLRQSYIMGMAAEEERASVSGLSSVSMQLTSAASPPVAGYLFDHVALALPFSLGGILQLLSAGLYYAFFHGWLPPEEAERQREAITLAEPVEPHAAD